MKTDLELQKDVMEELKWEPFLNSTEIGVAVKSGIVTLSGTVDNYSKKKIAEKAALSVGGVKAVAEDIVVKVGASNHKDDTEIAEAVVNALRWNSAVQEDKIKVKVENGWVTLEGQIDWPFQREAAKTAVESLLSVKGITNLITIAEKISTADLKKKIREAFHRSATIDSNNIDIINNGNKVTLTGSVRSYAEKQDAEKAAWNAPGVTAIDNKLEVVVPIAY